MNICLKLIFEKLKILQGLTRQAQISKDRQDQRIHQTMSSSSQLKRLHPIDEEYELLVDPGVDGSEMSQPLEIIVVKKEREEEYDQEIDNQWKKARSSFYSHTIQQKLKQAQIKQKYQEQIFQLFIWAKEQQWLRGKTVQLVQNRNIWKCIFRRGKFYHPSAELRQYKKQIKQLFQQLLLINSQCQRRQKETPAITQIIQLKLTSLKVIDIRYSLNINQQCRYQVSAFTLFKVVHGNRGLSSVTLKGIKVQKFKQFLRANAQSKLNQIQEQKMRIGHGIMGMQYNLTAINDLPFIPNRQSYSMARFRILVLLVPQLSVDIEIQDTMKSVIIQLFQQPTRYFLQINGQINLISLYFAKNQKKTIYIPYF